MTDADGPVDGFSETIYNGMLDVDVSPVGGGKVKLTAECRGSVLDSSEFSKDVFTDRTQRGTFLNSVEDGLETVDGVDAAEGRQALKQWMAEMGEMGEEEQEKMLPAVAQQILNGTQYPVEIYAGGEGTTMKVTLTYDGMTKELEFDDGDIVNSGPGVMESKIYTHYFDYVDIESDDWETIKERWNDNKKVIQVDNETTKDAIANRVIDYVKEGLTLADEKDMLANDMMTVWYDENNADGYEHAGIDDEIAWVDGRFILDQLDLVGRGIDYKGTLASTLISRGDLYGSSSRKTVNGNTTQYWAFKPEALEVSAEDARSQSEDAESEVDV